VHATNFGQILSTALWPRAGSGVVRIIGPLRFLAGCRTRRL